ncbi:hypothetical protein Fmac_005283 [Flemingia macrophylla]|uniref:Uncharacterized protein n=1 Tax=Flemingia macrophylla TaxID=520843 RepID=A0ABD1N8Q0_9FABA
MGLGARSFVEKIELTMIELNAMYGVKACPGQSGETGVSTKVLPTRISVLAWAMFNKNTTATLSWKDDGLSRNHSSPSRLTYAEDALRSMSLPEGCVQLGEARTL